MTDNEIPHSRHDDEQPSSSPTNNIERLFGHSFEIKHLEDGAPIPVGGTSRFSEETDLEMIGDFSSLETTYQAMHQRAERALGLEGIMEIADHKELDRKTFAALVVITKHIEEYYSGNTRSSGARSKLYTNASQGEAVKLSQVLAADIPACAELAAFAQGFLQREGISSSYFSGDVLWNADGEFSEEHSFIPIHIGDRMLIYNPANPVALADDSKFPSIYEVAPDFDSQMRITDAGKRQQRFVGARNLYTGQTAYFGVNRGVNVLPQNIVPPPLAKYPIGM